MAAVYPIVYFDALIVKPRESELVGNQAVYLALGINLQGEKELLARADRRNGRLQVLAIGPIGRA